MAQLPDISPMHEVQVWCASTRRWVGGFWFERLEADGTIRLRRGLDQQILPDVFQPSEVRRAVTRAAAGAGWGP